MPIGPDRLCQLGNTVVLQPNDLDQRRISRRFTLWIIRSIPWSEARMGTLRACCENFSKIFWNFWAVSRDLFPTQRKRNHYEIVIGKPNQISQRDGTKRKACHIHGLGGGVGNGVVGGLSLQQRNRSSNTSSSN